MGFLKALLDRRGAAVARANAIAARVEAEASAEDRAEHKGALLSSLGATVIHSAMQRRIDALAKSDWQPTGV
jgi:hypothetical protein